MRARPAHPRPYGSDRRDLWHTREADRLSPFGRSVHRFFALAPCAVAMDAFGPVDLLLVQVVHNRPKTAVAFGVGAAGRACSSERDRGDRAGIEPGTAITEMFFPC